PPPPPLPPIPNASAPPPSEPAARLPETFIAPWPPPPPTLWAITADALLPRVEAQPPYIRSTVPLLPPPPPEPPKPTERAPLVFPALMLPDTLMPPLPPPPPMLCART